VPIDCTRTGGEPSGQGAERQTAFSAAVQKLNRRFNDAVPSERFFTSLAATRFLDHALS
jgi:hypothetical protein